MNLELSKEDINILSEIESEYILKIRFISNAGEVLIKEEYLPVLEKRLSVIKKILSQIKN